MNRYTKFELFSRGIYRHGKFKVTLVCSFLSSFYVYSI